MLPYVQFFEGAMLVCFGISWPVDIINTLRVRQSSGKSFAFMTLILVGYLAGISSKIIRAQEGNLGLELVTWLYVANAVLVSIDIAASYYYRSDPLKKGS